MIQLTIVTPYDNALTYKLFTSGHNKAHIIHGKVSIIHETTNPARHFLFRYSSITRSESSSPEQRNDFAKVYKNNIEFFTAMFVLSPRLALRISLLLWRRSRCVHASRRAGGCLCFSWKFSTFDFRAAAKAARADPYISPAAFARIDPLCALLLYVLVVYGSARFCSRAREQACFWCALNEFHPDRRFLSKKRDEAHRREADG